MGHADHRHRTFPVPRCDRRSGISASRPGIMVWQIANIFNMKKFFFFGELAWTLSLSDHPRPGAPSGRFEAAAWLSHMVPPRLSAPFSVS
jgi:hypothetical protein